MQLAFEATQNTMANFHSVLSSLNIESDNDSIKHYLTQAERICIKKIIKACKAESIPIGNGYAPFDDVFKRLKLSSIASQINQHDVWQQLYLEFTQSIENEALFLAYKDFWAYQLKREVYRCGHANFLTWAKHELEPDTRYQLMEQWGSLGHPYHPNAKAKLGFSLHETVQYSPEFQPEFKVIWLQLDEKIQRRYRFVKAYPNGLQFPNNAIPVHPWQWHNIIKHKFKEALARHQVYQVEHETKVSPTLSFRTVIPKCNPNYHIKLSTAIHTTSAMRTVSPSSAYNGPRISEVLCRILNAESNFDNSLEILCDVEGAHYDDGLASTLDSHSKHLAYIMRESPLLKVKASDTVIPLASLFAPCPINNKPLLVSIIEQQHISPADFFNCYSYLLLKGQLALYLKYGIALESHQQNTLLVFDENFEYKKHINRDLGGIRISTQQLSDAGYALGLHSSSIILADTQEKLRNKFIHANLQSNLQYWIQCLHQYFNIPIKLGWKIVRGNILRIVSELDKSKGCAHITKELDAILSQPWKQKSLLRMRINPNCEDDIYQTINNPMV